MLLLSILTTLLIVIIYKVYKLTNFWKDRNIFQVNPWTRFASVFLNERSLAESVKWAYDIYPDRRYYGSYQFFTPSLFIRDLKLIKQILVKDSEYFPGRMGLGNDTNDLVLNLNLFSLKGPKWKSLRSTISPAFTSSKMKAMFHLMYDVAKRTIDHINTEEADSIELEMKDFFSKFSNDIIASCAFGLQVDSVLDPNNNFFKNGKLLSNPSTSTNIRNFFYATFPSILKHLGTTIFPTSTTSFFQHIVHNTISYREKEDIVRPDMIHLLMEAKKGKLVNDSINEKVGFATVEEANVKINESFPITEDVITAQALLFFLAAFETSSTTLSFLAYELALHPYIQTKLQKEIDQTLSTDISYEAILQMKYLDQVVCETLRKYPPAFAINRLCEKNYKIPDEDVILEKGCAVLVPIYGIHRDSKYFKDPEEFIPERFSDENKTNIVPGSFIPFGMGPRNCIGSRFALLEVKSVIVELLRNYSISTSDKTEMPVKLAKSVTLKAKNGIWLKLCKRKL